MFWENFLYYGLGILLIPGLIFAIWAQAKVHSSYNKYNQMFSTCNMKSEDMARNILNHAGMQDVKIERVSGNLTDHYNPRTKTVAISDGNFGSTSIASLGIVAHEIGHALQHKEKYFPLVLRRIIIPLNNFASFLLIPLIILGIIFNIPMPFAGIELNLFIILGMGIFLLAVILNLITLPVEYNASKRTKELLLESGLLTPEEFDGVREVLNSAALTYVAALVISILSLIRFVVWAVMVFGKSRRK